MYIESNTHTRYSLPVLLIVNLVAVSLAQKNKPIIHNIARLSNYLFCEPISFVYQNRRVSDLFSRN